jgi:hypothetical protein
MSKRTRGSARAHRRPGARPPTSRPAGARPSRPAATPAPSETGAFGPLEQSPDLPLASAALPTAPAAAASSERVEQRPVQRTQARQRAKPGSLLASRSATEYAYVASDLRRITVVSVILLAIMLAAWLAIAVFGLIPLDFY